jgi:hypothetical protein
VRKCHPRFEHRELRTNSCGAAATLQLVLVALLFSVRPASGQVTVAYKAWFNSWQSTYSTFPPQQAANLQSVTSSQTLAQIPAATVQFGSIFLTGGYFFSEKYAFPSFTDVLNVGGTPYVATIKSTATRTELDASIGFSFSRSLALTAGYKRVTQNYHTEGTGAGLTGDTTDSRTVYGGPIVGTTVQAALGAGFDLYENFAYGWMRATPSNAGSTAVYLSSESGLAFSVGLASVFLAFKYQVIDTKVTDPAFLGQKGSDVTKGPVLGALLRF